MKNSWKVLVLCTYYLYFGCSKDDQVSADTLAAYITNNPQWQTTDQLVACAAGGQTGFLDDPNAPLSMFFYPKLYSTNFKYYETIDMEADSGDLNAFLEKSNVVLDPLFNGFMARFPMATPSTDKWARVSFLSNDTLWYCKPVRIKFKSKPSHFDPDLVNVSIGSNAQPAFSWPTENDGENIIYFQIVVDERGDALSATYTTDKHWQYYDLKNVVFNVTRPGPVLPLEADKSFDIILMGISADNWVNTLSRKSFITTP